MEPDTEEPKIAPAQPEPGNKGEEAPIEVIESPYRKHLEEVEACKSRMAKALEEGDYDTAYSAAVNIASAINEMRNIKKQKQIVGQMELEDYSGS